MPSIIIHFLMNHDEVKIEIPDEECDIIKQSASKINMITSETDYCLMLRDNLLDAFNDFATNGPGTDKNFNRLNRYIMNWLNSFYAWIGFHERHYKDLFSVLKTKYYDKPELFTPLPDNRLNTGKTLIKMKNGLSPKR